jgi:class 3 adenylate cyclase/esterase/lipase
MPPGAETVFVDVPETHYATSGKYHIAYKAFGQGKLNLVIVPPFVSHVEMWWEEPRARRVMDRFGSFARVAIFDKRGTGMSDRVSDDAMPTPEERMDDVRAVMEAAGMTQATVLGSSEGGWMASLLAATYPERVGALVLHAAYPRCIQDESFPEGWLPRHEIAQREQRLHQAWIEGDAGLGGPRPRDPAMAARFSRAMRLAASPGAAVAVFRMDLATDIRAVLPSIGAPTLVTVREGDENLPASRYMAEHIPGAVLKIYPGDEHGLYWDANADAVLDDIEEFLTGARSIGEPDRVLATVLFTDIVGSTERLALVGDRTWREVLDRHDAEISHEVVLHRGRFVGTTGDGVLATFDGPARAIRCALAIQDMVAQLGVTSRMGLHTGEVEQRGDGVAGIAVHIAARVMSKAEPGEVLVSRTVKDLVAGSGINFAERGSHVLKGVPDAWDLFAVVDDRV